MSRHVPPPREQFALFDEMAPLRQVRHMDDLPESAHELIEVIGLQATIDLVKAKGGDEFPVPAVVDGDSRAWAQLEEAIGREAAKKLVQSRFKGTRVNIPLCAAALRAARDRDIVRRIDAGEPFDQVRSSHRITRSYMFRVLKKYGQ